MDNYPSQIQFIIDNLDCNIRLTLRQCLDSPDDFLEIVQKSNESENEAVITISIPEAEKLQRGIVILLENMQNERAVRGKKN